MLAELNELTNSSSPTTKTVSTNLSPISTTDGIDPIFEEIVVTPSTSSSSSTYGERTPTPPYSELIKRASIQHIQLAPGLLPIFYPHSQLETDEDEEGITITEIVEVHRIPSAALFSIADNNNPSPLTTTTPTITTAPTTTTTGNSNDDEADIESNVNNNNTSCSLSSTLTDSKTLDVRTPIVV
ncbi:probable G-protein coupled receptor CG31760 [Stomoxys calcitrans]|uniref:Uncharacterized protein n=1 Tax=Stomoxys calcitrans TaxID=35570 RepID=A0A1I8PTJ6_STOCA|nr:probable G-protein coupled receptor CG31760 [Stomoxys calcitrans]